MRDIGYLVELYPDKTGRELLAIQERERLVEELEYVTANQGKLDLAHDINYNGGYYCGKLGLDQLHYRRYYSVKIAKNGELFGSVESIVLHSNEDKMENIGTRPKEIILTRNDLKNVYLNDYFRPSDIRVTKKEWNEINKYINNLTTFWNNIKTT